MTYGVLGVCGRPESWGSDGPGGLRDRCYPPPEPHDGMPARRRGGPGYSSRGPPCKKGVRISGSFWWGSWSGSTTRCEGPEFEHRRVCRGLAPSPVSRKGIPASPTPHLGSGAVRGDARGISVYVLCAWNKAPENSSKKAERFNNAEVLRTLRVSVSRDRARTVEIPPTPALTTSRRSP